MITEQYIRMCKGATELQEAWEPKDGHRFLFEDKDTKESFIDFCPMFTTKQENPEDFEFTHNRAFYTEYTIWLPRQEDLQEIALKNSEKEWHMVFIEFKDWFILSILLSNQVGMFNDLTELWLSFVMETVYNKHWNGTTWEAIA